MNLEFKKKRGRKPLNQKKDIDKEIIKTHLTELESHKESLIAHIPLEVDSIFDCHTFLDYTKVDDVSALKQEIKQLKKELTELKKTPEVDVSNILTQNSPIIKEVSLPIFKLNECNENKDTKCWWCTYSFVNSPIYLPHKYINNTYYVTGYFCSFNCVIAYNYSLKDTYITHRANMIYLMYNQLLNNEEHIIPAPPKEILIDYGGYMDIDEFREKSQIYSRNIKILLPPMRSLHIVIEDCDNAYTVNSTTSFVPLNKNDIANAKKKLKLQRKQPKKSNYISIEESLGLIKV
jgi:hypothetical protein